MVWCEIWMRGVAGWLGVERRMGACGHVMCGCGGVWSGLLWTVMAVCLGSGRVDTSAGGCGWQSRHDREGSAGEARRRERDVEGVCVFVGCCMGIVRGVGWYRAPCFSVWC